MVTFILDGTAVQTLVTDGNGTARDYDWTVESVGTHTIRCAFASDEWLEAGYGEADLRIHGSGWPACIGDGGFRPTCRVGFQERLPGPLPVLCARGMRAG